MIRFLILKGDGINCERETKDACERAGGSGLIMHVNDLLEDKKALLNADAIVFPGGFSFGDQLGSGKILALKLRHALAEELQAVVAKKTPILGICNGFQMLIHLGLVPDPKATLKERKASLLHNAQGKFINRWVRLSLNPQSPCIWTREFHAANLPTISLPIRHGEGNLQFAHDDISELKKQQQIVFSYAEDDAGINGAIESIAGICDPSGHILGMMPHPEAAISPYIFSPISKQSGMGLILFQSAVKYLEERKRHG